MYTQKPFVQNNKSTQLELIKNFPFATLVTASSSDVKISHIPMYFTTVEGKDFLIGHMARANDHLQNIDGKSVAVFHGPHAYVSHTWYEAPNVVPTWNYVSVHVTGKISVTNAEGLKHIIDHMLQIHESGTKELAKNADASYLEELMKQIVGIKLEIEKIEGTWKLSQNKTIDTQVKIANQLAHSADFNSKLVAVIMNKNVCDQSGKK